MWMMSGIKRLWKEGGECLEMMIRHLKATFIRDINSHSYIGKQDTKKEMVNVWTEKKNACRNK